MTKYFAVLSVLGAYSMFGHAAALESATNAGGAVHAKMHALRTADAGHGHEHAFAFGRRGDTAKAGRTIRIEALDTLRFDKPEITVRAGETVRFVVTNGGKIRHELVIGDGAEQNEHEQEMRSMHDMTMHDEANTVTLAPGETKTIVWQFDGPGTVELGCHEPGHYAAGMLSKVSVRR